MKIWTVKFKYEDTGYIPNIVAKTEDEAKEAAEYLLTQQNVSGAQIMSAEEVNQEKQTVN